MLLSLSSVQSATYAKAIEKVTANIPETEIMAKNHALTGNGKYLKVLESDFQQDVFLL